MIIKNLFKASRPRFWLYLAGTYFLGYTIGAKNLSDFTLWPFAFHFLFFLPVSNFFLYGVNDFFDQETDALNEKKTDKEIPFSKQHPNTFFLSIGLTLLFSIGVIFIQPNELARNWMILFLFLSFFYSAPPIRFKAKPFVDSASNILYAIPGFIGYLHAGGQTISEPIIFLTLCWTAAMHLYSAIPDIEPDKKAKLMTTAVLFEKETSILLCFTLWSAFALLFASLWNSPLGYLGFIYPLIALFVYFNQTKIEQVYWYFPYLNAILGAMITISLLIRL